MVRSCLWTITFSLALQLGSALCQEPDAPVVSLLQTATGLRSYGYSPRMPSKREALEDDDYLTFEAAPPMQAIEPDFAAAEAAPAVANADLAVTPSSMALADPLVPEDEAQRVVKQPLSAVEKVMALAKESLAHSKELQDELTETKRQLAVAGTQLKEAAYMEDQLDKAAKVAASRMQAAASQAKAAAAKESQAEEIAKAESSKALSLQQLFKVESQKATLAQRRLEDSEGKALVRASHAEERARALEQQLRKNEASAQRALTAMKAYKTREQQMELQAASEVRRSRLEVQRAKAEVAQAQADAIKARESQAAAEEQAARAAVMEAAKARNRIADEVQAAEAQTQRFDDRLPVAPAAAPLEQVAEAAPSLDAYSEDASSTPK
mmetsp:Transcript_31717/g.67458  ORF Transcript_31717/g.67458 Transcript_31717/m.67458 type:complete len:382 (+) Transcript_31717:132-1277(+)